MTQTYIKLVRDAISSIIGGFAEEVAVLQVLQRNIEVDLSEVKAATRYAYRAYELGKAASEGLATIFSELDGVRELGETIRVRLTIQPGGDNKSRGVTMDVVTLPTAGVGAVVGLGYGYAQELAQGGCRSDAKTGRSKDWENPSITIAAIFPGSDNASMAKRTEELMF